MVAVLAGGACLTACTDAPSGSGEAGFISGKGIITMLPVDEREAPGEVAGETLDGEQISLSDFAGRTVVVNVWGAWCGPCRREAPDLVAAADELADQGVAFLGIDSRDRDQAAARAFVRRYEIPYPSIYDPAGETLLAFRGTLTPNSIPSTVVIDEQGRVAARVLGEVSENTLVGLVEDVQSGTGRAAANGGR